MVKDSKSMSTYVGRCATEIKVGVQEALWWNRTRTRNIYGCNIVTTILLYNFNKPVTVES